MQKFVAHYAGEFEHCIYIDSDSFYITLDLLDWLKTTFGPAKESSVWDYNYDIDVDNKENVCYFYMSIGFKYNRHLSLFALRWGEYVKGIPER